MRRERERNVVRTKVKKKFLGGFNWKGVADGSYRGRTFDHVVREDVLEVGVGEDLLDGEPGGREEVGERLVDGREQGEGALGGEVVGGGAALVLGGRDERNEGGELGFGLKRLADEFGLAIFLGGRCIGLHVHLGRGGVGRGGVGLGVRGHQKRVSLGFGVHGLHGGVHGGGVHGGCFPGGGGVEQRGERDERERGEEKGALHVRHGT